MRAKEIVEELRNCARNAAPCRSCERVVDGSCTDTLMEEAAEMIERLLTAARKMHLWIFLNTGDEQKVYDECGLSDEMNAMLGYGGQFELRAERPKEET